MACIVRDALVLYVMQHCSCRVGYIYTWLTTVTLIAVVSAVILQVTFIGQRDAGPRFLAPEQRIWVT